MSLVTSTPTNWVLERRLPHAYQNTAMLELRPACENCNAALPPDSTAAMICKFECTFCRPCVENILNNVCPNCGGGFSSRPIRPNNNWKGGNYLGAYPASTTVKHRRSHIESLYEPRKHKEPSAAKPQPKPGRVRLRRALISS